MDLNEVKLAILTELAKVTVKYDQVLGDCHPGFSNSSRNQTRLPDIWDHHHALYELALKFEVPGIHAHERRKRTYF